MTDATQTSSLNLLLIIAAAVLIGLGITWFAFDHLREPKPAPTQMASVVGTINRAPISSEPLEATSADTVEAHIGKAHLAIDANMFFEPAGQNALYFVGLALSDAPEHPEALQSLNFIADRLSVGVNQSIALKDFERPYKIAQMIGQLQADHPLVLTVQQALQEQFDTILAAAYQYADDGSRDEALLSLAESRTLPGIDSDRIASAQAELEARLRRYEAALAEEQRAKEQLAIESAPPSWLTMAEAALSDRRLITPDGDSALHFLAEADDGDPDAIAFRDRLQAELLSATGVNASQAQFDEAERMLAAAENLGASAEDTLAHRAALDRAFAENEASKIIPTAKLVWRDRVAPVYPRNAERRGTEGQVDIAFTVTASGETTDVYVMASEPAEVFDRAAIQAVQQWQFEPHSIRGLVVNQRTATRMIFQLN